MKLSCIYEGYVQADVAGCLVIDEKENILVLVTDRGIELPKGRVNGRENVAKTAVRETYEEAGIRCEIVDFTPIMCDDVAFYIAHPVGGSLEPTDKAEGAIKRSKWMPLLKVLHEIVKEQKAAIQGYLNRD